MKSAIELESEKFLLGAGKILDRLIRGPGAQKGTKYYSESVHGEYEFLRKKAKEITERIVEQRRKGDEWNQNGQKRKVESGN